MKSSSSSSSDRRGRFVREIAAGGAVSEARPEPGGNPLGLIAIIALFALLGLGSRWWLIFAIGLLISIVLHELGHFMTARWTGMKVTQFFVGFGPRVWSMHRGETEYGVRALPFGAFVRIIGMNNLDELDDPGDEPFTYRAQTYPRRLLVITAGSLMHLIVAVLLLSVVYTVDGQVVADQPGVYLQAVEPSGPAAQAGLVSGDVVISIDGVEINEFDELGATVRAHAPSDVLSFDLRRGGTDLTAKVTVAANEQPWSPLYGEPYIGVQLGFDRIDHSPPSAVAHAVIDLGPLSWDMAKGVVKVLNPVNIVSHLVGANDDLTTRPTTLVGVTGISDDVGESQGMMGIFYLLAILNVFVGIFNMLPLLPLDGGHALIATYERVRERGGQRYHADVAKAMPIAMAVMMILALLFIAGLYLDLTSPL
ncbi:MAG: hypothetical protein CSA55_05830 [Ilumatobacter coccineus]|uniref:PDZ domain-containing protein n=1 Tax=Ilumatobacter coccineus TaxID=467094 RepID=A0A2G6K6T3_9ACTN|nr:MAG: hypothetical protein CSA55_05830 [Ilumatobacter coccineus]